MAEKRVFILGAGFSACAGLPLASDFFAELMKWMQEFPDKDLRQLRERLRLFAYIQLSTKRG